MNTIDVGFLKKIAEQWRVVIPPNILTELGNSIENHTLIVDLNKFWWGMALHTVFSVHLQNTIDRLMTSLTLINVDTYGLRFAKSQLSS
jgi:hypothetical protein